MDCPNIRGSMRLFKFIRYLAVSKLFSRPRKSIFYTLPSISIVLRMKNVFQGLLELTCISKINIHYLDLV